MSVLRKFHWPVLAVLALVFVVAISSCSKKEVKQDEPLINPSGDTGGAVTGSEPVTSGDTGASTEPTPVADTTNMQTVYFDYDSYRVTGAGRDALNSNIAWLKSNPNATVQVEGHCDERGTTEYNLALGERRANAARDYMVKSGISRSRISVISYGEERPADPGHDESAWSKNRRAAFVILTK